jgi:hypothetical protein
MTRRQTSEKTRRPIHQRFLRNDVALQVLRGRLDDGQRPLPLGVFSQGLQGRDGFLFLAERLRFGGGSGGVGSASGGMSQYQLNRSSSQIHIDGYSSPLFADALPKQRAARRQITRDRIDHCADGLAGAVPTSSATRADQSGIAAAGRRLEQGR